MTRTDLLRALAPTQTLLVAVSKTYPAERILEFYEEGQRDFGENRVQEMVDKWEQLPKDIRWHQIGHLQTNKVKYVAPFVHLIHAVDSWKLLLEINKQAAKNERIIDCLLQVKIAAEDSKFGLGQTALQGLLDQLYEQPLPHVRICGLMGMATFTHDQQQVRAEFAALKKTFDQLKSSHFSAQPHFKELSMGMSGDYPLALEMGSTMVRVGSLLFGQRT